MVSEIKNTKMRNMIRNMAFEIIESEKTDLLLDCLYKSKAYDTVLALACKNGNKKYISKSLKAGANYNFIDHTNKTPLMNICYGGHDALILELLNAKADPNEKNSNGGDV